MNDAPHVLISLKRQYAEAILSGQKQFELRRRKMNISPGTVVWLYVKSPVASVWGCATVLDTHCLTPSALWDQHRLLCGVSRGEFFAYFQGLSSAFAVKLG